MTSQVGVDISSWQHPQGAAIDWGKVSADGKSFVVIKATQGVGYVNPFFDGPTANDAKDAAAAGLVVGAYHFAQPSANDAQAEANHFLSVVSGHDLAMGLWLDLEDLGSMAPHESVPWATEFLAAIAPHAELSGLYTTKYLWSLIGGSFDNTKLWLANPTPEPGDPQSYMTQTGSGPVDGIVGNCDLDTLNVPRGVNPGPKPPPPVVTPPAPPAPPEHPPAPPVPPQPTEVTVQVPQLSQTEPGPATVNEAVRAVQALLVGKGGQGVGASGIDGRFGAETDAAVRRYQEAHQITVDGIVGEVTWTHLCNS